METKEPKADDETSLLSGTGANTMVMPDRRCWYYFDLHGTIQGPFSGFQMNAWYKDNYLNPDLRVKKIEETDFEPLDQLVRRTVNSFEPFLVGAQRDNAGIAALKGMKPSEEGKGGT